LIFCCAFILAGPVQATSIALIYESSNEDLTAAMELTQASLANRNDLSFLERQAIDTVLAEQKIAAGGLIEFETAARLNAILKADLLVIALLAETGSRVACDLVIFDTHRGIRFTDKMISEQNMEDWISACRKELVHAAEKFRHPETAANPFCIQRVLNVDLPPEAGDQFYAYVSIIERELVQQTHVCLLERSRLDSLRHEAELTLQESTNLLTSAVYLDMEASRGTNNSVTVIGQFRDNRGNELHQFTLSGSFEDGSEFVGEGVREISQFLGIAPPVAGRNREAEAARFYRDSMCGSRRGVLQACEAACMLSPQSHTYRTRLGMLYIEAAQDNVKKWPNKEGICKRDGQLRPHGFSSPFPPRSKSWYPIEQEELFRGLQQYQGGVDILQTLPATETADPLKDLINTVDFDFESIADPFFLEEAQHIRRSIKQQLYDYWVDERHENRIATVTDARSFAAYTEWLITDLLTWLKPSTVTSGDWYRKAMANAQIWLRQAQQYGLDSIPSSMNDMGRFLLGPDLAYLRFERPSFGYLDKTKRPASPSDIWSWAPLYAELKEDRNPVLRFYGIAGELNLRPKESWSQDDYDRVWEAGLNLIETLPAEASIARYQAYHAVLNALMLYPRREMIRRHRDLFEMMVARHEFVFAVAWRACAYQSPWARVSNEELASWTDRVLDYLRRDDLIFLPKPGDVPGIRNLFLSKKARRTEIGTGKHPVLVPDRTRQLSLEYSDWNGPAHLLHRDAINGVVYFNSFGFLDPRSTSRPAIGFSRKKNANTGHVTFHSFGSPNAQAEAEPPIGVSWDNQNPPHLFMRFYKLNLAEAATDFLGEIAVDHTSLRLARADSDHLTVYRMPDGDMLDFDVSGKTLVTNRLRDFPAVNSIDGLVQIGSKVFCKGYKSTVYEYDLVAHSWSTLLSPNRIAAQNPVEESGSPFVIHQIFQRPEKNELYLVVRFPSAPENGLAGIWRYNVNANSWSKGADDPGCRLAISQPEESCVWLYGDQPDDGESSPSLWLWDYTTPRLQWICGNVPAATEKEGPFNRVSASKQPVPRPPYLRRDGQVWTAHPFGYVDLSTGLFSPVFIPGKPSIIIAFADDTNGFHILKQNLGIHAALEVLDLSDESVDALIHSPGTRQDGD